MLKKLFQSEVEQGSSAQTRQQAILFLFVGCINTLFGYACFALFVYLGFHYAVAAGISTCLGVLFNFQTTGRIVFKNAKHGLIFKFIAVYTFLYGLNVTSVTLLKVISTNYYLTEFVTIIPLAALAFILNKFVVFQND